MHDELQQNVNYFFQHLHEFRLCNFHFFTGANRYCIDKNYGQYLIIWDRLFGTFEEERLDEPISYGCISQTTTKNVAFLQISTYAKLWDKMKSMNTFGDKVRTFLYGPGWSPGKPRLGDPKDIPDVRGRSKWYKKSPILVHFYMLINVISVTLLYIQITERMSTAANSLQAVILIQVFYSFASLGLIYDGNPTGIYLDFIRILLLLAQIVFIPSYINSYLLKMLTLYINSLDLFLLPILLNLKEFKEKTA